MLHPGPQQRCGDLPGFGDAAGANAQLGVHHRRVVEHHVALARRGSVLVNQPDGLANHRLGELLRVADGGRAADEGGICAVEGADALQAADHVGQVRAEHAPVGVDLVDDHILQVFEQLDPLCVVGQYALVQHVRVGNHNVARLPYRRARRSGRIPVVGIRLDAHAHILDHAVKLRYLVAGKRLGGKQVQRPGSLVGQNRLEHRHVVAQRLARGRGRYHHEVLPRQRGADGLGLVDVGPAYSPLLQRPDDAPVQLRREFAVNRRPRRHHMPAGHVVHEGGVVLEFFDVFSDCHNYYIDGTRM